jgi:hypothetical protein
MRTRIFFTWLALFALAVLLLSTFVFDTATRRQFNAWQIRRIAEKARQNPADARYSRELIAIARGRYSFAASYALSQIGTIGESARPVIGDIAELVAARDRTIAREAALSLANLGPISESALDALEAQVRFGDPGRDATGFSAYAIGRIGSRARRCLPLLRSKLGINDLFDDDLQTAINLLEDAASESVDHQ